MAIWPFTKAHVGGPSPDNPPNSRCSFCGRSRAVVGPMVEGPNNVYICVECVRLAHEIAEGNRMQPATSELNDAQARRVGHMHIRCYFRLERTSDGNWRAVSESPAGVSAQGGSPREAVKALQSQVLEGVVKSFAADGEVGDYFTNHAEERLRQPFKVTITEDADRQLRSLPAREQRILEAAIQSRLEQEPAKPTKAIKRLRPNLFADFELRAGDLRALQNVDEGEVAVLLVGRKVGNKLIVEGEEFYGHQDNPAEPSGNGSEEDAE